MIQTYYWIAFIGMLMVAMFVLVPVERIRRLAGYGLIGGVALAVGVFALAHELNVWSTVGGYEVFGYIPVLPSIGWFFPTVIFANYFPKTDSFAVRAGWVLLFAVGSAVMQYIFALLGMWRSIHWNVFYTFLLAVATHTILSFYIMRTEQYLPE